MAARSQTLAALVAASLAGCASPRIEYRPIPQMLIPPPPTVPTIAAAELACLSDDAYLRDTIRDLRDTIDEKNARIDALKATVSEKNATIAQKNARIDALLARIAELENP